MKKTNNYSNKNFNSNNKKLNPKNLSFMNKHFKTYASQLTFLKIEFTNLKGVDYAILFLL